MDKWFICSGLLFVGVVRSCRTCKINFFSVTLQFVKRMEKVAISQHNKL